MKRKKSNTGSKPVRSKSKAQLKNDIQLGTLTITVVSANDLPPSDENGLADPYVRFDYGIKKYKTKIRKETLNPSWNQSFQIPIMMNSSDRFMIQMIDHDPESKNAKMELMGTVILHLDEVARETAEPVERAYPLDTRGEVLLKTFWVKDADFEPEVSEDFSATSVSSVGDSHAKFRAKYLLDKVGPSGLKIITTKWEEGHEYEGEFDGLLTGEGVLRYADGSEYKGRFHRQELHGKGALMRSDGSGFDGEWSKNLPHGSGKAMFENGDHYDGTWNAGEMEGKGVYTFADGSRYEGEFKSNNFHGEGVLLNKAGHPMREGMWGEGSFLGSDSQVLYNDGTIYDGPLDVDGLPHGQNGILKFVTGDTFVGEFQKGELHGNGKLEYADDCKFEGSFVRGVPQGGKYTNAAGDVFNGTWENGQLNGEVRLVRPGAHIEGTAAGTEFTIRKIIYDGGQEYEGATKDGVPHGKGRFSDGALKYDGAWRNGKREGKGKLLFGNGDVYEGEFKEDKRHGQGTLTTASGLRYSGNWLEDTIEGEGTCHFDSGDVYAGMWKSGRKHGKGKIKRAKDGTSFEGTFEEDVMIHGTHHWPDGSFYTGSFLNGTFHGVGNFTDTSGKMHEGEWNNGELVH